MVKRVVGHNQQAKTEAIFSLSRKKETFTLQNEGESIPQQNTPTYLGVKLDRRLSWSSHISTAQSKTICKMAVIKKLAVTKWGANMKILTQVYTGSARPHIEYASNAWATAAKSSTEPLAKIQNASLPLITGGIDGRWPSMLWQGLLDSCLWKKEEMRDCFARSKGQFLDAELKLLTLEALDRDYPNTTWTRVYTDGSAESAIRNGGGGVYVRFPDGSSVRHSIATGLTSTNFRAEASVLLAAAQLLNQRDSLTDHTVFLTECRAVLQSLQTRVGDKTLRDIQSEMQALNARTTTVL
ncbi:uncharacterized protein LOC143281377 [Babylonia areolata]|uniref:uncharacterized protein LOC143281377 n=1 Tax=Babylonia areolata TaxID=304850 RepID=UPI003FD0257D